MAKCKFCKQPAIQVKKVSKDASNGNYLSWENLAKDAVEITDAPLAETDRTK